MKTLILGAGVIGAAIAFQLSRRGHEVTILEAGTIGGGASGRSFGWINASFHLSPEHFRLRMAGIAAHHRLAELLPDCPTRWPGCIWYEEPSGPMERSLQALGYPVGRLTRREIAARLPALGPVPEEALVFPAEGAVDPAELARRLIAASGAKVWRGVPVLALAGQAGRITGAVTAQGLVSADQVVVAAGTGAPALLETAGVALPMLSRPGLMLATAPLPPVLPVILAAPGGEIRQDAAGRLLMPTAANHQGDAAKAVAGLPGGHADAAMARLRALLPGLAPDWQEVTLAHRPVPGDGLPVIGEARPGLWVAVMHSGVTLAAIAGEAVAAGIAGADDPLLAPFAPGRFG
jgi:glycine/D-amino acid oxidase-like deaminating enzyme